MPQDFSAAACTPPRYCMMRKPSKPGENLTLDGVYVFAWRVFDYRALPPDGLLFSAKESPCALLWMFCLAYVGNIIYSNLGSAWTELGWISDGEGWLWFIRLQLLMVPGFAIAGPAYVNSLVPSGWLDKWVTRYWGLGLGVPLILFSLFGPMRAQ